MTSGYKYHLPHSTIPDATACGLLLEQHRDWCATGNPSLKERVLSPDRLRLMGAAACFLCRCRLPVVDLNAQLAQKILDGVEVYSPASVSVLMKTVKKVLDKELGERKGQ